MATEKQFVIDTSILVRHFRQQRPPTLLAASIARYGTPIISEVTLFELEVGAVRHGRTNDLAEVMDMLTILPVNLPVWMWAASIQAYLLNNNLVIGLEDTLIAATALDQELPLLTLNRRHFARVPDLHLLDIPDR